MYGLLWLEGAVTDQEPRWEAPPPAPPPPRRRLLRVLPWSTTGMALAGPYLMFMLFLGAQDLRCDVQSGEWCGFATFIFTAPASLLMALLTFGVAAAREPKL